jgi:hypothetical protein
MPRRKLSGNLPLTRSTSLTRSCACINLTQQISAHFTFASLGGWVIAACVRSGPAFRWFTYSRMTAAPHEALTLQRPLRDGSLRIVAGGDDEGTNQHWRGIEDLPAPISIDLSRGLRTCASCSPPVSRRRLRSARLRVLGQGRRYAPHRSNIPPSLRR